MKLIKSIKPEIKEWQIQFDKKFNYLYQRDAKSGVSTSVHEEVKQFIKDAIGKPELKPKISEWIKQFDKRFPESLGIEEYGEHCSKDDEIKQFIKEELEKSYFRGFNDGNDSCGEQAKEVRGCEFRELEKLVIKFEDYLPIEFLAAFFKKLGKIKKV